MSDSVAFWPAWYAKPAGPPKEKATVPSATVSRRNRRVSLYTGIGCRAKAPRSGRGRYSVRKGDAHEDLEAFFWFGRGGVCRCRAIAVLSIEADPPDRRLPARRLGG